MTETANKKKQLRLELPKDASAIYANTVMITHTANEVIFDFAQRQSRPRAKAHRDDPNPCQTAVAGATG